MGNNVIRWITHFGSNLPGYYPPDDGFVTKQTITLEAGTVVQRIGGTGGNFVAPYFTDGFSSALPYDKMSQMFSPSVYVLKEPLQVIAGHTAPWFGQYGGGIQYMLPQSIQALLDGRIFSPFGF
jgi:hypothetical protein